MSSTSSKKIPSDLDARLEEIICGLEDMSAHSDVLLLYRDELKDMLRVAYALDDKERYEV